MCKKLEWYTHCPVCDNLGVPFHENVELSIITYYCTACTFLWKSESRCVNFIQDKDGHYCDRDSTLGECQEQLCPRVQKIFYELQWFADQVPTDYRKDLLKITSD